MLNIDVEFQIISFLLKMKKIKRKNVSIVMAQKLVDYNPFL